ncbi:glycosyl transferase [Mycobacterium adipatum]|jgi:4-amino-4-deoxy-L-arabinose transferase-like glycosyltransferase|uniref:Glycosyl transferase n=1 Tax=Mycobacterium adipatum TaxID=1682113 RepID=A0A172UL11_9MYCO|nr:glycosyltransferase family 39 protein [Mycobacterium adipatum]ANE79671.1 glycosyl transferase [Mycobacterium adipatum]MBI5738085.1 glycosyltransferase family 39 protein [Mycolicibacterium neoaurum]
MVAVPGRVPDVSAPPRQVRERVALGVLLVVTAAVYLWNLSISGWANSFYSAAVQAGSQSWTALFFGSSDAANAITVDKTPAALWVMGLSVRLFGFSSWTVLAPQAVMGVLAVAVLYASVRRVSGPGPALLAGTVLAFTPVAALMFRFNNPDALLVVLLVAAAYCTQRACAPGAGRWWLVATGTLVGGAFLAKMLQAVLVLPAFGAAYLICASAPLPSRIRRLGAGVAALVLSGGWYLLLVELWPAAHRPYIGGSQGNSIVELALGYNGVGRLTGAETGGLGNLNFDVGWGRLLGAGMGAEIGWLLPAALIGAAAGFILTRRAPRTDPARAALIIWAGWLAVTAVVFSYANGIVHSYYTVALAPAIAACLAIGANLLWRNRTRPPCAVALAATLLVTVTLAVVLLARRPDWMPWLRPLIAVVGVAAAVLLLVSARLPGAVAGVVAALAAVSILAGPVAYSVATAAAPHQGAIPMAGPARGGGFGPGFLHAPEPTPDLAALLTEDADRYTWPAAVVGSNNAAGYQLATGVPVMAVGGFNGTDPAPTLKVFRDLVAQGRIHYFIESRIMAGARADHGGSEAAVQIADWVARTFSPRTVGGTVVYDLTS